MDWLKIAAAVLLVAMFFMILPSAKRMVKESPKGSASDWMGFIIPIVAIVLFVILLIALV
jgi:divalent metal cation (Fe/Co/Zn/Cd) transporter